MNIIICDDIPNELEHMHTLVLEQIERLGVKASVHCYQSGETLLKHLNIYTPSICFLDIYMKGISGVELAKHICKQHQNCAIIFVTSSSEHMADGFEIGAIHYLLKPVDIKGIELALKRAFRVIGFESQYVELLTNRLRQKIQITSILYVESQAKYCDIYLRGKAEPLRVYMKLDELNSLLPAQHFLRCHRSFIINLDAIYSLTDNNSMFLLENKTRIPIRRQYKADIITAYENYYFEQSREDML